MNTAQEDMTRSWRHMMRRVVRYLMTPMETRRGRWGAAGIIGATTAAVVTAGPALPDSARFCIFLIALVGIVVAYAAGKRWDRKAKEAHVATPADTLTA